MLKTEGGRAAILLAAVIAIVGLLTAGRIYHAWIPYDEGVMAQSAERVMLGEVPHRDFVDLWTGGLSLAQGAAFGLFGPSLRLMRTLLLVSFLATLPVLFFAARRVVSLYGAAAVTLVAGLWSVYAWPLPLPSWYVLLAQIWGAAALLAYLETRKRRWLVAAGAAAGAAIAVKITGLYFVAAVLLGLAFDVQARTGSRQGPSPFSSYKAVVAIAGVLLLAMVVQLTRPIAGLTPWLHFSLPIGALIALLVQREWITSYAAPAVPWREMLSRYLPFLAGVAIPVGGLIAYFAAHGAVQALYNGVFVVPRVRFDVAGYPLPGLRTSAVAVLPMLALLAGAPFVRRPLRRVDLAGLAVFAVAVLAVTRRGSVLDDFFWLGLRIGAPLLVLAIAVHLGRPSQRDDAPGAPAAFFLAAAAALCSLVQVPFAYYTYFLYFAPFVILAFAALNRDSRFVPLEVSATLAAMLIVFAGLFPALESPRELKTESAELVPGRGGITVDRNEAALYARLTSAIQARSSDWIYVWHDAPEVAFLAGRRNPTRSFFEAFDDSVSRSASHIRGLLVARDVRLVVLTSPEGAAYPMPAELRAWIDSTYARHESVGRFTLRWRETR